jgi:hypothetical protein
MRDDISTVSAARGRCLLLLGAVVALGSPAQAQDEPTGSDPTTREQCFSSHEQSQVDMRKGQLMSARSSLLVCSRPQCPPLLRSDCLEWYTDVERSIPSVVFAARRGQKDLFDVKVTMDGKLLTQALDGRAHEMDPGRHKFKVESGDLEPIEREVLVSRGEKGRLITFEFPIPESERLAMERAMGGPGQRAPEPKVPMHRPVPVATYILAGTAVVLAGAGGVVGFLGKKQHDDFKKTPDEGGCAPYCEKEDADSVRTKLITADVLFATGAATATIALFTYLLRPEVPIEQEKEKPPSKKKDAAKASTWSVSAGLGSVAVRGSF